jgi:lysophospholipase L1-like esterase
MLLAALSLSFGAVAVLAPALPSSAVTPGGPYVALGDSYASGPAIPAQVDPICLRSNQNYASLVAAALGVTSFRDVSCSGASTNDMAQSQHPNLLASVAPQLDALSPGTRLVTVSIGGNDIGFADVALTCGLLGILPFGAPCTEHYTQGGTDALAAAIAATAPKVGAVLQAIHARSPQATVLVVGYLDILPLALPGCWPLLPIAPGDLPYLQGVEAGLNRMLAAQASLNGARFVDTFTPSIGHDACEPIGAKWVEGFLPTSLAYPVHPNALGMLADAAAVLTALQPSSRHL